LLVQRALRRFDVAVKFRDDEIVIAWQSFTTEGVPETITRGSRLRGRHPAVKKCPQYFVEDGTPEGEWPSVHAGAVATSMALAEQQRTERARREPPPIPDEMQVVCIQGFTKGARTYSDGTIYRRDDPAVKDPETRKYFGTPVRPLD